MIAVEITGPAIPGLPRKELSSFARQVIHEVAAPFPAKQLSIVFVDDATMKRLNRRYRGKPRTTDILTFATEPAELIVSVEQAKRQARQERHSLATEVKYLVVHGILHALGYDHETDRGEMNALELQIRRRVGLD